MSLARGALGLALVATTLAALPAVAESRRLAIVVGNNAGGPAMPPLRYAESDAGKMARVLIELGDVGIDDVMLLQGRKVADLERALADAKERVGMFKRSPETRTVLIFYFSGHSDGEAIEMGLEKLPYGRLKSMLTGTGADLRVFAPADGDFLRLGEQDEVGIAGDGILGAVGEGQREEKRCGAREHCRLHGWIVL